MLLALALVVVAACNSGGENAARPSPSTPGSPASSTSAPPATTPSAPVAVPRGWRKLAHPDAGIVFWFPPLPGKLGQGVDATADGPRFRWTIKRSDLCDPRGMCRAYEFAAVNDGCPGNTHFPTLAHRWKESGGKHSISRCDGGDSFAITPLRIVTRADHLHGVIYDANVWFPKGQKIPGALAAVLNFPKSFHPNFEAIAFYFEDATSLDVIETVLRLVKLDV